jgi:hypothetical protein
LPGDDLQRGLFDAGLLPRHTALRRLLHVLEQVPALGHLHRLWRAGVGRLSRGRRAVATDNLHSRGRLQPRGEWRGLAIRQQLDRLPARQIAQDGAIVVAFPKGPIIDPQDTRARRSGKTVVSHPPHEGIRTATHPEPTSTLRPGLTPQRTTHEAQGVVEAQRAPPMRGHHPGPARTEDLLRTPGVHTEEAADAQRPLHHDTLPREISHPAGRVAMHAT